MVVLLNTRMLALLVLVSALVLVGGCGLTSDTGGGQAADVQSPGDTAAQPTEGPVEPGPATAAPSPGTTVPSPSTAAPSPGTTVPSPSTAAPSDDQAALSEEDNGSAPAGGASTGAGGMAQGVNVGMIVVGGLTAAVGAGLMTLRRRVRE